MSKAGIVADINPNRGMVAIRTEDGDYTIIELTSSFELCLGHKMVWEDETGLGSVNYTNLTTGKTSSVYVQNHHVSRADLGQQLLIPA